MRRQIERVRNLTGFPPFQPMASLHRIARSERIVDLASNENPYGASPHAVEAARRAAERVHRYPDGDGAALKEAIARKHGVSPQCVALGAGISELLVKAAWAWLQPRDAVLVPDGSFPLYELVVQLADHQSTRIPLTRFRIDLAMARNLVDSSLGLVYLASPNNPTGMTVPREELETFLKALPEQCLVLLDEAYQDYVEPSDMPEPAYWVQEKLPVVVLRTFSKVYGLAGLRVGYAVGAQEWIQAFEKVRLPYSVNQVAVEAAVAALEDEDFRRRSVAATRIGRAFLSEQAAAAGHSSLPSEANFILMEAGTSGDALARRMLEKGVYVRSMTSFGFPGCVRVSVGTEEENQIFAQVLKRM